MIGIDRSAGSALIRLRAERWHAPRSYGCHAACLDSKCEGLFPLFGCLCHAIEKDRRAFYRP